MTKKCLPPPSKIVNSKKIKTKIVELHLLIRLICLKHSICQTRVLFLYFVASFVQTSFFFGGPGVGGLAVFFLSILIIF